MTDPVKIAVVTGFCAAVPSIITSIVNRTRVQAKIQDLHLQLNSRLGELLEARESLGLAKGVEQQKQAYKNRAESDSP